MNTYAILYVDERGSALLVGLYKGLAEEAINRAKKQLAAMCEEVAEAHIHQVNVLYSRRIVSRENSCSF